MPSTKGVEASNGLFAKITQNFFLTLHDEKKVKTCPNTPSLTRFERLLSGFVRSLRVIEAIQ